MLEDTQQQALLANVGNVVAIPKIMLSVAWCWWPAAAAPNSRGWQRRTTLPHAIDQSNWLESLLKLWALGNKIFMFFVSQQVCVCVCAVVHRMWLSLLLNVSKVVKFKHADASGWKTMLVECIDRLRSDIKGESTSSRDDVDNDHVDSSKESSQANMIESDYSSRIQAMGNVWCKSICPTIQRLKRNFRKGQRIQDVPKKTVKRHQSTTGNVFGHLDRKEC